MGETGFVYRKLSRGLHETRDIKIRNEILKVDPKKSKLIYDGFCSMIDRKEKRGEANLEPFDSERDRWHEIIG